MIRYDFDLAQVESEIRAEDQRWFKKAEERTRKLIELGRFEEVSSIWSKVKPTFMRLQMNKCVFCERQFENPDYGTIEFDLEHFRPKSSVAAWPDLKRHPKLSYRFATGLESEDGYYWLAYDLSNYAASCKVCNTTFKLNFFPVADRRGSAGASIADLSREKPFLCYAIGTIDEDPEELVTFVATTAVPAAKRQGHRKRRGQVIIEFFGLNEREQLHRERARMIGLFGSALQADLEGRATAADRQLIARMDAAVLPHAGCLRAFRRLWVSDPATARRAYDLCRAFSASDAGTAPPDL